MNPKAAILKAAMSQLAGIGRKIVPLSKEKVLERIEADAPDMAKSIIENEGFSYSPRLARLLEAGKDYGHMMSVVKEQDWSRLPVSEGNIDELAQAIKVIAEEPALLKRLQRGENLGGWVSDNNLVLDPAVRHLSKDVATLRGMNANQDAGFSLLGIEEFPLKYKSGIVLNDLSDPDKLQELLLPDYVLQQEAIRRLAKKAAAGAGGIATGGYLSADD